MAPPVQSSLMEAGGDVGDIEGGLAGSTWSEQHDESLSCDTCGKTYTRLDHLVRHQRSHSDVKPFPCKICGKEFARVDVLKRHVTNHEDNGQASKRRRKLTFDGGSRVAKACRSCAVAKLKCEDEKPCQRCRQKQIPCVSSNTTGQAPTETDLRSESAQDQDFSYSLSSPAQERHHSNFVFEELGEQTLLSSTIPTNGSHDSFPGSASQRPAVGGSESNADTSALASHEIEQGGINNVDFAPSFSPGFDESSLAYFLNGIMIPPMPISQDYNVPLSQPYQARTPKDFLDFGTFNIDSFNMDMVLGDGSQAVQNFPMSNTAPSRVLPTSGTRTPSFRDRIASGNAAFMRSVWLWTPTYQDYAGKDNLNLSLPPSDMDSPETRDVTNHSQFHQCLDNAMRDKILGFVLSTCDSSLYTEIASSFPNADLLNKLLHLFMATHVAQKDSWLHFPTFELNDDSLLLTIMIVSAGAVICSVPSIRRLGFALQEAVRTGLATKFENDNRWTRDLSTLQAFALKLQVGLWSGDKRKMELAESFAQPLITMLRRAGRFRRPKDNAPVPAYADSQDALQMKWRQWVHAESYKRLACHMLVHDSQASMACLVAPLLSPAEFSLTFPACKELWSASSAQEWRTLYLRKESSTIDKGLSISQGINSVSQFRDQQSIDLTFSAILVIHSTWAIVYSNSLLNSLTRPQSLGQKQQESPSDTCQNSGTVHLMEQILINLSDWEGCLQPELALVSERTLLNLHLSFEHVQVFAGREGEEEARRAFPILQRWVESSDARKAIWHAGQILKAARSCSKAALREFGSICVYHAGLTFWAYAVLLSAAPNNSQNQQPSTTRMLQNTAADTVWLDGEDGPAVQRFISLNRGTPVVRDATGKASGSISPNNPKALMELCISLLRKHSTVLDQGEDLPLVENLNQLMRDLGNAAQGLLSGHIRRSNEQQLQR